MVQTRYIQTRYIRTRYIEAIKNFALLEHPFYQDWMEGKLSLDELKSYAVQYYPFVAEFPRYVSALHSWTQDATARKIIFENLLEEEGHGFECDHPELWLRFAEGLGLDRDLLQKQLPSAAVLKLCDFYRTKTRASFATGLGALLAYEGQSSEISRSKEEGLTKNYGIDSERSLAFFKVHAVADKDHSEDCLRMIADLPSPEQDVALENCHQASKFLWNFLTELRSEA